MTYRLSSAEEAAIDRLAVPRVEHGVSNADLDTLAVTAFRAGREYQRRRTSRLTRDEVEALADVYRAELLAPTAAGIVSRVSRAVRDELAAVVRDNEEFAESQRAALLRMIDQDLTE